MVQIDLSGPQGNAFALMILASTWARQLDYDDVEIQAMLDEMRSGDYENLIAVFEENFGDFVEFV